MLAVGEQPHPRPGFQPLGLLRSGWRSDYFILVLSAVFFAVLVPFTPGLLTAANLANVGMTLLPLFVVAAGLTVVLITGGIDLSVTSMIALCSITGAAVMSEAGGLLAGHPLAVPAAVLAMLLVGALVGACNGLAVAWLRLPPFIVTLTSMMFFSGLAIWLTQSRSIGALPAGFIALGSRLWIALPLVGALGVGLHWMLERTVWGRWVYAVGHNARTAVVSGVPVGKVIVSAYVVSGVLAAVASVLYTGQAESGSPILAQRLLLDIVGAVILGGTSLFGGRGTVRGTLFGALLIKLLDNSLNLMGLSYFVIMVAKGGVILVAALMDSWRNRAAT